MSLPDATAAAQGAARHKTPGAAAESRTGGGSLLPSRRGMLLGVRITLGGVFFYAGVRKIGDPLGFADSLATFGLLPDFAIPAVALSLPPFEVLLGILLVAGWRLRAAALGATVLAGIFGGFFAQAMARGLTPECGCFGPPGTGVWPPWLSLARSLLMGWASAWLWRQASVNSAPKSHAPSRGDLP